MNIEDIKKKVEDYKAELIKSRECCDIVDFSDEVLYLISIIEQMETTLIQCRAYNNSQKYDGIRITTLVDETLQAIRGN